MAVDLLSTWKSTLAALPQVADTSWAANFANWYAGRIAGIITDPTKLVPTGWTFTFNKSLFTSGLLGLGPTPSAIAGITAFANAWLAAMQASTALMAPGSFVVPTSPKTLFSVVTTTTIDAASTLAAKAKLLELITAPTVDDANNSQFPVKFREATLLLTVTVVGLDSEPPPSAGPGPQPLTASAVPLV